MCYYSLSLFVISHRYSVAISTVRYAVSVQVAWRHFSFNSDSNFPQQCNSSEQSCLGISLAFCVLVHFIVCIYTSRFCCTVGMPLVGTVTFCILHFFFNAPLRCHWRYIIIKGIHVVHCSMANGCLLFCNLSHLFCFVFSLISVPFSFASALFSNFLLTYFNTMNGIHNVDIRTVH